MFNRLSRIWRFVCWIRSGAKIGFAGKSRLPSKPRNSTAANPCWLAKSRIFFHSQAGQPKVEKAIGKRIFLVSASKSFVTSLGARTAKESPFRNLLRLLRIALELSFLHLLNCVIAGPCGQGHVRQ